MWINFHPKPERGDWNGSGGHVNFSDKSMREENGLEKIKEALNKMAENHKKDI